MDKINFNRGIEGFHTHDTDHKEKSQLPDSRQVSPQGERVKNHVEHYFNQFNRANQDLNRHLKPKISDPNLVSPSGYLKGYRKTLTALADVNGEGAREEKVIAEALALLETVGDDMEQLNEYIACLIKV